MTLQSKLMCAAAMAGFVAFAAAAPAQALTMQECSAKYKAAKDGGTLNGQKWNDFRKAECGTDAAATPAAAPAAPAPTAAAPAAPAAKKQAKEAAPLGLPTAPMATGNAVFPNAVDPKYAKESAGKGRMHTCVDQYNSNKASNGNGGMKWIEKGGGYYSECNKRLKGAA
jgi:pyruvate/2-oxoglutarate dehydrogenase complex dihydrolipoamide acyltransferase (E2) component